MSTFSTQCSGCQRRYDNQFQPFCESCGSITEVEYDLSKVRLVESDNPYVRFRDLLPVRDRELLPKDATFTPTVHARGIGKLIGLSNLYLKNETVLPTGTTKDRMAAISLAYLYECGVRRFCTSSTGNSSTAYGYAMRTAAFEDFDMFLFTASDFRDRVQHANRDNIRHYVLEDATFTEAFNYGGTFASLNDCVSEKGFFNPGRREGLKMTWMEAVDQVEQPIDWYVQAVSSAMGVFGTYKGAKELHGIGHSARVPQLLCVQQTACSPMATAWSEGSEVIESKHIVHRPQGIAKAILRGDPTRAYPHIRKIVKESKGEITSVSEDQIREAQQMLFEFEGIRACFSASAAVAGLIQQAKLGRIGADETVLINLTGSDREDVFTEESPTNMHWLKRAGEGWLPKDPKEDAGYAHSGCEPV